MENRKTILEWLQELPEPIRTQALDNTELYPVGHSNTVVDSLAIAISLAFTWRHTPQKISYWSDIHDRALSGTFIQPEFTHKAQGDANFHTVLRSDQSWLMAIQFNGEKMEAEQIAIMDIIVKALNNE